MPQPPQFIGSVASCASDRQAKAQKVRPSAPQVVSMHTPSTQRGLARPMPKQSMPQSPQLVGSTARFSHMPPQLASSGRHPHIPAAQCCASLGQVMPHMPQLKGSVSVLEQKSAPKAVQLMPPSDAQVSHMPPVQVPPTSQVVMQSPQAKGSVEVMAQKPPQSMVPGEQTHTPDTQDSPDAQSLPQKPQLASSADRSAQYAPQFTSPGAHMQIPPAQVPPIGQALPQKPQLSTSLVVSVQAVPQSMLPGGHSHRPALQVPPLGQGLSQKPQCASSVMTSAHAVPQSIRVAGQPHSPPAHSPPGRHGFSQNPQCASSVIGSMQPVLHARLGARQGAASGAGGMASGVGGGASTSLASATGPGGPSGAASAPTGVELLSPQPAITKASPTGRRAANLRIHHLPPIVHPPRTGVNSAHARSACRAAQPTERRAAAQRQAREGAPLGRRSLDTPGRVGYANAMVSRVSAVFTVAFVLAAGAGAGLTAGCGKKGDARTVKIVSSLPRTGSANAQTGTIVNGIKLAIEEVGGKVGEFTIVYEDWDDASARKGDWDGEVEAANAQKAIKDPDILFYIGTFNSGAAKISMPVLSEAGLVMISPGNTAPGLTKPGLGEANEPDVYRKHASGKLFYFRVVPADDIQGKVAAEWVSSMGGKKVYILDDRSVYGKGIADVFHNTAKDLGLEILGHEGTDPQAQEYKSLMAKIAANDPDFIFFGGTTQTKGGQIAKDMVGAGMRAKLVVPDGCYENAFITAAGAENVNDRAFITFGGLPPDKLTGKGAEFVKAYKARFKADPEAYAVYGYTAAKVALEALAKAGKKDRTAVRDAVAEIGQTDGALGTWKFDANGDTTLTTMSGNTVKDGKFAFVTLLGGK